MKTAAPCTMLHQKLKISDANGRLYEKWRQSKVLACRFVHDCFGPCRLLVMISFQGNYALAARFTSAPQRARVVTENWVAENGYCLACESDHLLQTANNTRARDFECANCGQPYELKSSGSPFGKRVPDGAYSSMITRIHDGTLSNLLLLQYGPEWQIKNFSLIHRLLITEPAIQRRKPLSVTARRAGWTGCNISLETVPPEGRIQLINSGVLLSKDDTRQQYALTQKLASTKPVNRGWTAAILSALHRLHQPRFTLGDAYRLEPELALLYPQNRNIKAKIRQQLQVLRDAKLIIFEQRGVYRLAYAQERGKALGQID